MPSHSCAKHLQLKPILNTLSVRGPSCQGTNLTSNTRCLFQQSEIPFLTSYTASIFCITKLPGDMYFYSLHGLRRFKTRQSHHGYKEKPINAFLSCLYIQQAYTALIHTISIHTLSLRLHIQPQSIEHTLHTLHTPYTLHKTSYTG